MKKIFTSVVLIFLTGFTLAQSTYSYTGKPKYKILTRRAGTDTLGIINVELFPNIAPKAVRNFDSLVSTSFYDSTAFHRVIPGFMIQGGDPNSRHGSTSTWGYGNPNQPTVDAEFSAAKHVRGILSAARVAGNINSATSQFFICVAAAAQLNGQYTIYGHVTSGMSVADTIVNSPTNSSNRPLQKIDMFITYAGSNDSVPNPPVLNFPPNGDSTLTINSSPLLKWNAVHDAIIYDIQVATDPLFTDSVTYASPSNLFYPVSFISDTINYYWHVRSNNGGHFSAYSPTWTFKTKRKAVVDTNTVGIQPYAAAGKTKVFPNPGPGKFNFSGFEKGTVLQIFDPSGKLIQETVIRDAETIIDLEGKEKGLYMYRLRNAKQETEQGKLILR